MRALSIQDNIREKSKTASESFRVTDRHSYLRKDTPSYRDARTHLKSRSVAITGKADRLTIYWAIISKKPPTELFLVGYF